MEIKKQKRVTRVKNIIAGYKCDSCAKEINEERLPDEWHHFASGHNEWGNDSYESYESYDVCSPKCYVEKLTKVVGEMEDIYDGKVDDMEIQFAKRIVNYYKSFGENIKLV